MTLEAYTVPAKFLANHPNLDRKYLGCIHMPAGTLLSYMSVIRDEKSKKYYNDLADGGGCFIPEHGEYVAIKNNENPDLCISLECPFYYNSEMNNVCEVYRTKQNLSILDLRDIPYSFSIWKEINKITKQRFHGYIFECDEVLLISLPSHCVSNEEFLERIGYVTQIMYDDSQTYSYAIVKHFNRLLSNIMLGKPNYETMPKNTSIEQVVCNPYSKPMV